MRTTKYSRFISGELIDLCVPSEQAITDGWADWFNDPEVTRWLDQGAFPNTVGDQRRFLESLSSRDRLALMVCEAGSDKLLGTISLSAINWLARSAQISLVVPQAPGRDALAPLEAMALLTEHGFEMLQLQRIWAGQAHPGLARWGARLELIGYQTEAILRRGFVKGAIVCKATRISCVVEDYNPIKRRRGHLWPGATIMRAMIERRKASVAAAQLEDFLERAHQRQREDLALLDAQVSSAS